MAVELYVPVAESDTDVNIGEVAFELVAIVDIKVFRDEPETDVNTGKVTLELVAGIIVALVTWVIVIFDGLAVVTCMFPNDRQIYFPREPIGVHFSSILHVLEAQTLSSIY